MANISSCEFQAHPWRHRCIKCKKEKADHVLSEEDVKKFESVLSTVLDADSLESKSHHVYAWVPPEIPHDRISQYFSYFPQHMLPEHDSPGLLNHMRHVSSQVPLADLTGSDGRSENSDCLDERMALIKILGHTIKFGFVKEWEQGMPQQCRTCMKLFEEKELTVLSKETPFHPACFICCVCKEQLTELIHCPDPDGNIYCVRHYSEHLKKRCHACDELIFERKFAEVGKYFYHRDHLCCFECDEKLESEGAFEEEEQLYCTECYQKMHSGVCELCGKMVGLDRLHIIFEGKFWHSDCFKCSSCGEALESFEKRDDKFYCEKCYKANFLPKCVKCEKSIEEQGTFINYEGKMYHTQCFCCADCNESFESGTFVPHEDSVYCKGCYLRNFGTRCSKCQYAITDDQGVMYKEKPYHSACFTCSKCSVQLGKNPFKLVGEKMYCLNCFGETFCKSCHSCEKQIVLSGKKDVLYSYENFNWHASCFICHSCRESLENRTFILRGTTLVCKDCTEKAVAENKREKEQ